MCTDIVVHESVHSRYGVFSSLRFLHSLGERPRLVNIYVSLDAILLSRRQQAWPGNQSSNEVVGIQ
jgi:hypothetical protein